MAMSWLGLITVGFSSLGAIVSVSFAVKTYRDCKESRRAAKKAKQKKGGRL